MPSLDVNQPFDLFGQFWTPNEAEKQVPGRLFRTSEGIRIQLFEDLRPGPSYVPRHQDEQDPVFEVVDSPDVDTPLTIHGRIGELVGKVTAYECVTVQSRSDMFNGGLGEYILAPMGVIFGAHTAGTTQVFSGVRMRTANIDEWASLQGFSSTKGEDGTRGLNYREPSIEPIQLANGAVLSLNQRAHLEGPHVRGGAMTRDVWFQIQSLPPSTWSAIDGRIVTPLSSLITLCLGRENGLVAAQLTFDGERWVDLVSDHIRSSQPANSRIEGLAGLADLGLSGVATWLNKVDNLGPLPPVVAHFSSKRASIKFETELLEMTTVAEGLHARLFPDEKRFSDADCKLISDRVLQAVGDMDVRVVDVLRGMLTHIGEPGYPSRLKGLARIVEAEIPTICGKVNKWAQVVSNARNKYAHRTAGFLDEADIDTLFTVLESLRWLLRCILLLEAGLDSKLLAARLRDLSSYRLFLERASENIPAVYRE